MNASDFLTKFKGFLEINGNKPPTEEQWKEIVKMAQSIKTEEMKSLDLQDYQKYFIKEAIKNKEKKPWVKDVPSYPSCPSYPIYPNYIWQEQPLPTNAPWCGPLMADVRIISDNLADIDWGKFREMKF